MLNKNFILVVILLISVPASSQNWPFEMWHEGKMVLEDGDTLRGLLKYDIQKDLVEFSEKDRTADVFTARKVIFYEIFDESVRRYRQFYALPYTTTGTYKTPIFFELLTEGKFTLLAREYLQNVTTSTYYAGTFSKIVLAHRYFFMDEHGEIEQFIGNRNDLLDKMGKHADAVEKYIRKNHLRIDEKYDLVKVVAYYNSLIKAN